MSERKHKRSFFDTPEAAPTERARTPWWFWYAIAFIWGMSCGLGISALLFWLYHA